MTKAKLKTKKRPACRTPTYPLAHSLNDDNCTTPDIDLELQDLCKHDKLSAGDYTKHVILSNCAAKPYTL